MTSPQTFQYDWLTFPLAHFGVGRRVPGGQSALSFGLFSQTDRLLERALDGLSARQRVSAHNIANVDTPGYKRYTLSFEQTLRAALGRPARRGVVGVATHPRHFPIGAPRDPLASPFVPTRVWQTSMRSDGNNVDIEAEMAQLMKDQIHYSALAQSVAKRYAMVRDAIRGGVR